jgi:hypothetical protein
MAGRKPGKSTSTAGRSRSGANRSRLSPTSQDRPSPQSPDRPQSEPDRPSVPPNRSGTTAARPTLRGEISQAQSTPQRSRNTPARLLRSNDTEQLITQLKTRYTIPTRDLFQLRVNINQLKDAGEEFASIEELGDHLRLTQAPESGLTVERDGASGDRPVPATSPAVGRVAPPNPVAESQGPPTRQLPSPSQPSLDNTPTTAQTDRRPDRQAPRFPLRAAQKQPETSPPARPRPTPPTRTQAQISEAAQNVPDGFKGEARSNLEFVNRDTLQALLPEYLPDASDRQAVLDSWDRLVNIQGMKYNSVPHIIQVAWPGDEGVAKADQAVKSVIAANAAAAPALTGQNVTVLKRGDTRTPDQIRESGGFHGWGGSMSVPHARQWVTQVWNTMSQSQRNNWMQTWKAQTSTKTDRVTYVATGLEEQKSGNVYNLNIPMPIEVPRVNARIIMNGATLEESTIIAVAGRGEIVFLTGIPLKYVTHNNRPL